MLDDTLKQQLALYLSHLKAPLILSATLDDQPASQQMRELLGDIKAASSQIEVREVAAEPGVRVPSFAIHKVGEAPRVRFAGLPLGHEFTSLVLGLLHVSGHPPKVSDQTRQRMTQVKGPLRFETFFSQSCQNCPDLVQALNTLAANNPNVEHVAIDGANFQDEVKERNIMSVPAAYLNGELFGQGRMDLDELLDKLGTQEPDRVAQLSALPVFDVLIVGGGPAGAAAAIYSARKGLRTAIVTERFGGQVLDTMSIENFISVPHTEGPRWVAELEAHVATYPIEVIKRERAARLIPGLPHTIELESGATLRGQAIILATGAKFRDMRVPGEQEYRTRGVTYCPHCDGPLFAGKPVAVIGGGNSGIEAALDLAGIVSHVTVLEFADKLRADRVLVEKLEQTPNATIIRNARTTEVLGDGKAVTGLRYEDRLSGALSDIELNGIFVQIGLSPNTQWLRDTITLSQMGEIIVDERCRTSIPGVFAAGDATTTPFKQIIIAAGEGAKAALAAFEYRLHHIPN